MTNLAGYSQKFCLTKGEDAISESDAVVVVAAAFATLNLNARSCKGVFRVDKHLVPSVDFSAQPHLKCEFMGAIKKEGCGVRMIGRG